MEKPSMTVGGDKIQLKTEEELKKELTLKKAKLQKELRDGLIDGIEYNRRIIELEVPDETKLKNIKPKKTGKIILAFLAVVLVLLIWPTLMIQWRYYFQNTISANGLPDYSDTVKASIHEDPIQIKLDYQTEQGEYKGRPLRLTYKAYYDIAGIVVSVRDYWGFGDYDTLVPRDVGMIWGDDMIRAYEAGEAKFSQGVRNLKPEYYTDNLKSVYTMDTWGRTSTHPYEMSNNHVIPSTPEVREQILNLKVNDKVHLIGYLVRVLYNGISLDSSMTRYDVQRSEGETYSCEVIYVTKVEKVTD